jgi:hypothetical protein
MATSDELLIKLIETLAAEGCVTADFEADVVGMVGKLRIARDRAIRDMEAARLLPHGAQPLSERQHCHRSTVYRRAERGRRLSRYMQPAATLP